MSTLSPLRRFFPVFIISVGALALTQSILSATDSETLSTPQITVVSAKYGFGNKWADVTLQVQRSVADNGNLDIPAEGSFFGVGDVVPGKIKRLTIETTVNGIPITVACNDGGRCQITLPKVGEEEHSKASDEDIANKTFWYGFVGRQSSLREMTFASDGSITLNAGPFEQKWAVNSGTLTMFDSGGKATMTLTRRADGVWAGHWIVKDLDKVKVFMFAADATDASGQARAIQPATRTAPQPLINDATVMQLIQNASAAHDALEKARNAAIIRSGVEQTTEYKQAMADELAGNKKGTFIN